MRPTVRFLNDELIRQIIDEAVSILNHQRHCHQLNGKSKARRAYGHGAEIAEIPSDLVLVRPAVSASQLQGQSLGVALA